MAISQFVKIVEELFNSYTFHNNKRSQTIFNIVRVV